MSTMTNKELQDAIDSLIHYILNGPSNGVIESRLEVLLGIQEMRAWGSGMDSQVKETLKKEWKEKYGVGT